MHRRDLLVGLAAGAAGLADRPRTHPTLGMPAFARRVLTADPVEALQNAVPGSTTRLGVGRTIWSVRTVAPLVALTFDDGPDPQFTPRILRALDRAGVRATFNVMGWNALQHGDLLRAIVSEGHEVGNHTWTHQNLAYTTAAQARTQLERGKSAIEQVIDQRVRFFRPPRGVTTGSVLAMTAELGYDLLLWSVTRGPGSGPGQPRQIADYVATTVRPGDVLGLHDGIGRGTFNRQTTGGRHLIGRRETEVTALPDILARVADRGLRFVTASALLEAEGNGESEGEGEGEAAAAGTR